MDYFVNLILMVLYAFYLVVTWPLDQAYTRSDWCRAVVDSHFDVWFIGSIVYAAVLFVALIGSVVYWIL